MRNFCLHSTVISAMFGLLLFAAVGTGILCHIKPLEASPADIRGSGNVAVTGFTNDSGQFVLWSNGRITSLQGTELNTASDYQTVSQAKLPARLKGHIFGSANVACDVLVNSSETLVVFSDGSVKRPRHKKAAAGKAEPRILAGCVMTSTSRLGNLKPANIGGFSCRNDGLYTTVTFDQPFEKIPVVIVSGTGSDLYGKSLAGASVRNVTKQGFSIASKGDAINFLVVGT